MCKLEYYGNCDPGTKNQEYCIFHKPNKDEKEAEEFWRKFLERFKPRKEKIFVEDKEIERFVFEDEINCNGFVFPEISLLFDYAIFKGIVWFDEAIFEGLAYFRNATFKEESFFTHTIFKKPAIFDGAIFKGRARFDSATFKNIAFFEWTVFYDEVSFNGTTFEEFATFDNAKFNKNAKFWDTIFKKYFTFYGAKFRNPEDEAEAYRLQRGYFESKGERDKADYMFVKERRALRKARIKQARELIGNAIGWKDKIKALLNLMKAYGSSALEYLLADLTCKYGTDWKIPVILWGFFVLFLFPVLYMIFRGVDVDSLFDYWYFSIVTATTLGYGDYHPVGIGKAIASIEAIFGTFMWAVFLAVFARKYMR